VGTLGTDPRQRSDISHQGEVGWFLYHPPEKAFLVD
jgi:hypothetical protein